MLERFSELADGLNHPEGLTWNPADGLIYAGGEAGEMYAVTLDGEVTQVGSFDGSIWLGLAVDGQGRVYGCDHGKGEIARFDPSTGEHSTYGRGAGGGTLDTPNVAAFDAEGLLYVTCSGEEGRPEVVRIAPGGGEAEQWSTDVPKYPNGCLVTPDGSALIVVEAQAERIARIPILEDGSAGPAETVAILPDTDADGVAMDANGDLWATLYRPDGLVRIRPDGSTEVVVDDHLATTMNSPTNIAWVGASLDRAAVTHIGETTMLIADLGVAGQPLHSPEVP